MEQLLEAPRFSSLKVLHEPLDFVRNGEAVVNDVTKIVGFLEAFEDILECADEVENGDLGEGWGFFSRKLRIFRLMGEAAFLLEFAQGEEPGRILEFFVFNKLADKLPARIVLLGILFGWLIHARQQGAAFQIHQIGRHDDELGGQIDVKQLECIDVVEVLAGDSLDGDRMDIHLVFFDEVEQQVERTFENFKTDFVVVGFHAQVVKGKEDAERGNFPSHIMQAEVLLSPP